MSTEEHATEEGWVCPITGACTSRTLHRRCNGPACGGRDCYDCCSACQTECHEPPNEIDYDLPPDVPLK
jgi:hypothetical protein